MTSESEHAKDTTGSSMEEDDFQLLEEVTNVPPNLAASSELPSSSSTATTDDWQGMQPSSGLLNDLSQQPDDDRLDQWVGISQELDGSILATSSGNRSDHEETWTGLSGFLGGLQEDPHHQPDPESIERSEWQGLSRVLVFSDATFGGLSNEVLGSHLQVGPEQIETEENFFWSNKSSNENAVSSGPEGFNRRREEFDVADHRLNMDDADINRAGSRKYGRSKELTGEIDTLLEQVPKIKHRSPELLDLQKLVRKEVKEIIEKKMDVPTLTGRPALFPTTFEVERYASTKDPAQGPSMEAFKIELSEKFRTPWNKRLAVVFADHFIASKKHGYTKADHPKIVDAFLTHIKIYRNKFMRSMEEDFSQEKLDEEKTRARDTRRRALHLRRLNACATYIDDPSMRNLLTVLKDVNYKVCSGDETAHERGKVRYAIVQPKWRNRQLHFLFRVLDRLHLSTRLVEPDHRFTRGAPPRVRVTSDRFDHSDPIPGLPENFYCPIYLASIPKYKRDALQLKPPCHLYISEGIKQLADEHARLTSVEVPALPDNSLLNSPFFPK